MILLTMLGAGAPAKAPAPTVEFVGFSRNEQACAWRLHVTARQGDMEDRYTVIHLVATQSHKLVAAFRDSASIERFDAHGKRIATPARVLADAHPEWSKAGSRAAWQQVRRRGGFGSVKIDFKNNLVRVLPDEDDQHLTFDAKKKALNITTIKGAPLGFQAVARLYEGNPIMLGHYRTDAPQGGSARAHLEVYHSHAGHVIAVVNSFGTPGHMRSEADFFTTPDNNPIGTTNIGSLNMIETDSQSIEVLYKQMHPRGAHDYDVFVGTWF